MHALPCPDIPIPVREDSEPDDPTPDRTGSDDFIPLTEPLVRADLSRRGPVGRVVTEWSRLCRRPEVLRRVNGWPFIDPPVAHLDEVLVRSGFGGEATDSDGDRILWHLADLARTLATAFLRPGQAPGLPGGPLGLRYREALTRLQTGAFAPGLTALISVLEEKPGFDDQRARGLCLAVFRHLGMRHPVTEQFFRPYSMAVNV